MNQWLICDFLETAPKEEVDRTPKGCRYDEQIMVLGREVQEKIENCTTFMIGAGALGCEFVKGFALMGLGVNKPNSVVVTDNDNIEVSNLNRQFLFRNSHVGHSKSDVACAQTIGINPAFKAVSVNSLVSPDTEERFNDAFWEAQDIVINAVDNIKARQ